MVASDDCDYFVFNNEDNKGFTIVSGDDEIPAIIGYTTEGNFDAENIPDGLKYYLECYENTVDKSIEYYRHENKARSVAASSKAVGPLVTATWAQSWPYNLQCPYYIEGHQAVTGCVATSMSQLMYFYRNPIPQTSGIPGYTTTSYQLEMPAITGERTYNWDLMQDSYDTSSSEESCQEVAKLMYHAGSSVAMDYADGSGAYTIMAWWAMVNYFGFYCEYGYSGDFTRSDWLDMLNCELDSLRPFYIGGNDGLNGHAFLCDGRDADGLHHINWGWEGAYNGYFNLSLLDPWDQNLPGFNKGNEVIVRIKLPAGYEAYTEFRKLKILYRKYNEGFSGFIPGEAAGNCDKAAYDNCKQVLAAVECKINEGVGTSTQEELVKMEDDMKRTYAKLQNSVIPFEDGYYYIEPSQQYLLPMALKDDEGLAWWTYLQEGDGNFIWKLKYDNDNQSYYLSNIHTDGYISNIVKNEPVSVNSSVDPYDYKVSLEYAGYDESLGFSYTIRHENTEGTYVYLNRDDGDNTSSGGSYTIGWTSDVKASQWRLVKVDDSLAESLIAGYADQKRYEELNSRVQTVYGKSKKLIFNINDPLSTYYDANMIPWEQVNTLKSVMNQRPETDTEEYYSQLLAAYNDVLDRYTDMNALQEFYSDNLDKVGYYSAGNHQGQFETKIVRDFEQAMDTIAYVICHPDNFKLADFTALRSDAKKKLDIIPDAAIPYDEGQYAIVSALWFDKDCVKAVKLNENNNLEWATLEDGDENFVWNLTYDQKLGTYRLYRNGYTLFGGDLTFTGLHYEKESGTEITIRRSDDTSDFLHLSGYGNGYNDTGVVDTGLDGSRSDASLWLLVKTGDTPDPTSIGKTESSESDGRLKKPGKFILGHRIIILKDGVKYTLQGQRVR